MKKIFLLLACLICSFSLSLAQSDSLTIYVRLAMDTNKTYRMPEERCFRKKDYIHRLHLDHFNNYFLALQQDRDRKVIGFLPYLVQEMKSGRIVGKDARDNKTPYTYQRLLEDMYLLEGLVQGFFPDTMPPSRVEWGKLATYIDLITADCFDQEYSRNRRIIYSLRILYCDPHLPDEIYGVAIFSLPDISALLEGIFLRNGWNALQMIHAGRFQSIFFRPEEDRFRTKEKPAHPESNK